MEMQQKSSNNLGIHVFGADVSISVTGLDKPIKTVARGLKSVLGLSRKNINKAAKFLDAKTQ